jgi:hypothetical protein
MEAEALRIISLERKLKETASTVEEWLHEAYCLLPDVMTWLTVLRRANESHKSDELEKYDRVLDEFQADIGTTLQFHREWSSGRSGLVDPYFLSPLRKEASVQDGLKAIRGIYRGRSIIPRVWYARAEAITADAAARLGPCSCEALVDYISANDAVWEIDVSDTAASFGRAATLHTDSLFLGWFD